MTTKPNVHVWARPIVVEALAGLLGRSPYAAEVYAVSAVATLETVYGTAWKIPEAVGSNNWGAIQAGPKWTGETFEHIDTHPTPDGKNVPYRTRFRKYPTPLAGATDLALFLTRMGVIGSMGTATNERTFLSVSAQLYRRGYYEGFGRTADERIEHHRRAVASACAGISRALNEPIGLGDVAVPERTIPVPIGPELPGEPSRFDALETVNARVSALVEIITSAEERRTARDDEMRSREEREP